VGKRIQNETERRDGKGGVLNEGESICSDKSIFKKFMFAACEQVNAKLWKNKHIILRTLFLNYDWQSFKYIK